MIDDVIKKICDYRISLLNLLIKKKISPYIFGHKTYLYLRQNKIKYRKKSSSVEDYLINYFYFLSKIERKLAYERDLVQYDLHCKDLLFKKTLYPIEQRDKMVKKLFIVYGDMIKIESIVLVRETIVQINTITYPDFSFYITKNTLKELMDLQLKTFDGFKVQKNFNSKSILVNFIDISSIK